MASVKALRDGEEQGLECLGELRAVKGALAKELLIQKPVTIPGAGSYLKDFTAPLYGRGVMAELAKGEKGCGPCVGVLAKEKKAPKGYVRRQLGPHLLCAAGLRRLLPGLPPRAPGPLEHPSGAAGGPLQQLVLAAAEMGRGVEWGWNSFSHGRFSSTWGG